ncbi:MULTISPECIES: transaldolase [unclassified Marinobacterium]|jgi:transaldolase|uniref:transaldolase n=1 Tax=unclassified Marinobacterium TaxID=2644139 RepID=UPI00156A5BE5|nr:MULTISPECIES: transaldolase [unclassified Marinobacterium]NRP09572.1 Transaldolase [Marinobacterium sp. xm-g-48]NRP16519.1 Transaldolase [Marinobacterium sp. xm-a-152]NRP46369.1 Transaldolase [Marinobacterium sp. xm-d-543]NRP56257.1 Transaldolase [Marinobacterium sp. xm-d-510]NRP81896.1 Transaldolase [Marinobacterium sp. xm-d-509]
MNQLDQLKSMTTVVADTGDIDAIRQFTPQDATTNPSLLLKASEDPKYAHLLEQSINWAKVQGGSDSEQLANMTDHLAVLIGSEITKIVPGYISTEVDARFSFDTQATLKKAYRLIELYEAQGISKDRVLIKIASTWEGIQAARELEKNGIRCNLTLLFGFAQAQACADAGAYLISPFVGRILDWYKKQTPDADFTGDNDPGVQSVTRIYNYYKANGYDTVVMGASFRNTGEIISLAGCDRLTIGPSLLEELAAATGSIEQRLVAANASSQDAKVGPTESAFRWGMNEDAMATEKLSEGIRNFAIDQVKLEKLLASKA